MRIIGFILGLGLLIGSVSVAGSADRGGLHAGLFTYTPAGTPLATSGAAGHSAKTACQLRHLPVSADL